MSTPMPGNTYTDLVRRFESEYIKFNPDVLVIYKGFSHYIALDKNTSDNKIIKIMNKSKFISKYFGQVPAEDPYERLLKVRKSKGIKETVKNISKKSLSAYKSDVEHIIQLCKNNNILMVLSPVLSLVNKNNKDKFINDIYSSLFYYPSISVEASVMGVSVFNSLTQEIALEEDVTYVDISLGIDHTKEYFYDASHFTIKGTERVADNYSKALEDIIRSRILFEKS